MRRFKIQFVNGGKMSAFERAMVRAFDQAVQKEYALLARKKIATVVLVDGKTVRGIPKKVDGRWVVRDGKKEK